MRVTTQEGRAPSRSGATGSDAGHIGNAGGRLFVCVGTTWRGGVLCLKDRAFSEQRPQLLVGAGTVLTVVNAWAARKYGARSVPTGGVDSANMLEHLGLPYAAAGGGTWLASRDDLKQGKWDARGGRETGAGRGGENAVRCIGRGI